jgi:hypothetical protein
MSITPAGIAKEISIKRTVWITKGGPQITQITQIFSIEFKGL